MIKTGSEAKLLLALPIMESPARSPLFDFKLTINEQKKKMDADMVAFLRVYTEDVLTDKISVIGSCFVPIFKASCLKRMRIKLFSVLGYWINKLFMHLSQNFENS